MEVDKRKWFRIFLVFVAAAILEATSILQFRELYNTSKQAARKTAEHILTTSRFAILDVVDKAEQAVRDNMWIARWCLEYPDSLGSVSARIVENNKAISGSTIALVPGHSKKFPLWAPYAHQNGDKVEITSLATPQYDYPAHPWFTKALENENGYWSEPYLDEGGGNIMMTTYSMPVKDEDGVNAAVITADISLDWLSEHVGKIDSYDDSFSILVSRDGLLMVAPSDSISMKKHLDDLDSLFQDRKHYLELEEGLMGNKTGEVAIKGRRDTYHVYYSPIERTGWSMAVVFPEKEIYWDVRQLGLMGAFLQILGLLMLFFILRAMAKSWIDYQKAKDIEEHMESELQIGRDIQMSMIPKNFSFPERTDLDISATIVPARQVGGDLYDFYMRDGKLFFCIGDVSGKGVPASLVMAVTRSLFRNISALEDSPKVIVEGINRGMFDMTENEMFVTFFCGVLDMENGVLRYCNAGHNPPLVFTNQVEMLPVAPNIPLGVELGMVFEEQQLRLHYDDALYLYTDGVSEAENLEHEQFGMARMQTVLHERRRAQEHLDAMLAAVRSFVGEAPQSDDITMLFIHYLNEKQASDVMEKHLILHNEIQQIPQLASFLETIAEEKNISQALTMSLNLALEEAVTNVILYAYPEGTDGLVDIEAVLRDDSLEFILSDSGKPFDPTAAPEADITLGVEERQIGGLGIYLVKQIMDSVTYKRENGRNILHMTKKI